jgi:hypothetical protein
LFDGCTTYFWLKGQRVDRRHPFALEIKELGIQLTKMEAFDLKAACW